MEISNLIKFSKILGKLKLLKRTGWVKYKIPDPESVAEHSFQTALLTLAIAPKLKIDVAKAVKMALIHDLGESEIGDVVTVRAGVVQQNYDQKILSEKEAIKRISSLLDNDEINELFLEFEENQSPEAKLVKQIDKLEMAFQAFEYENKTNKDLEEFFQTAEKAVYDPYLAEIFLEIKKLRK